MRRWPGKAALSLGLMCAVLLLLPVLAVLQYRWVGQVSQAERERMQANLLKITTRFAEDFDHEVAQELANASISFQRGYEVDPNQMAEEYQKMMAAAPEWHDGVIVSMTRAEDRAST